MNYIRKNDPSKSFSSNIINIPNKSVIPCIKLSEELTYDPWEMTGHEYAVIKIQDLITSDGRRTNSIFDEISNRGGLHDFFQFKGKFIISSIAPDKMIFGLSIGKYQEIIETLGAEWYFTPDCETYCRDENDLQVGDREIQRIIEDTNVLIDNLKSIPIGLVKGSNYEQLLHHALSLKKFGIRVFSFHSGEYLLKSNRYLLGSGIRLFFKLRENVPYLIAYGIGSRSSIKKFHSADWFITQSHYTRAFKGNRYENGRTFNISNHEKISKSLIMNNLSDICSTALSYGLDQRKLSEWFILHNIEEIFEISDDDILNLEAS